MSENINNSPKYEPQQYFASKSQREKFFSIMGEAEKQYQQAKREEKTIQKEVLAKIYEIWNECFALDYR